jgi:hypothetical protein
MSGELDAAALAVRISRTPPPPSETVLDGQVCLYAPAVAELLVLNESAGAIWDATASGEKSVGQLLAEVAGMFAVPAADAAADVVRTLERFLAAGLLAVTPAAGVS